MPSTLQERTRSVRPRTVGTAALMSDSASVFEGLFADQIAMCVWNRPVDEILRDYLRRATLGGPWQRLAHVDTADPCFDDLLYNFAAGVGKIKLTTELCGLVDLFATLADASRVGVRMTATTLRECPRFHVDRVGLRLVCTWLGEGTEWLRHEDVIREHLGHLAGAKAEVKKPRARIQHMDPFAVGILKGENWPGNRGRGAVHRSPEPQGFRVFVSVDAI